MPTLIAPSRVTARPASRGSPELTVVVPCYNERPNVAPLVEKLDASLVGIDWEVLFVDDNSPDGTAAEVRRLAQADPRVRCIRRIGRRGLASAVIEGALASSALFIAVIDGDLQHDETRLPLMLEALRAGDCDLAVASRHLAGGDAGGLGSPWRQRLSEGGIRIAQRFLPTRLTDPMSGFFALPRPLFERIAPRLTGEGFKILLDIVLSAREKLRVHEIPARFRARTAGESKLDVLVLVQFVALLFDKLLLQPLFHGLVPLRFLSFAAVGALGVVVHLAVLTLAFDVAGLHFPLAQSIATLAAMAFNFQINNQLTYRDQRLRGPAVWWGLLLFILVCGLGAMANIGVASALYPTHAGWTLSGAAGALIGVVWNYAVSATLVWRAR